MAASDVTSRLRALPAPSGRSQDVQIESYRRLAEVFHHVLSEQSLETLLERIADTLAELVPYDALQVYEADNGRRELIPVLVRSEWEKEIMRTRPAFGQGITGWAVDKRQPVLANQAHLDSRVAFIPGTPPEPESLISIPLVARGALKGALTIYRLGEEATFDADEFELATWFGDAAALALDNAQVRARLEHQAQTDSLTGLYNHRHFHERLRAELTRATRARDTVAVLMFDIDEFKRINDICGHAVGDEILVEVAELVTSLVRTSDVVCRVGGEEFAVIMPSCTAGDALGLARRLAARMGTTAAEAAGEVTLSTGIAQGPDDATNPRELVAYAESAMMTAKARGGDRVLVFSSDVGDRPDTIDPGRDMRSIIHLKMLQSLVARLSRLNSIGDIAAAIVDELRGLIDYHSCRVYIVEGDELLPIAVKGDGVAEEQLIQASRIELGVGITGHVAQTGRSVLVHSALECDYAVQIPGTEPVDESVVACPLRYDGRTTGVVFLSKLGVGQFDGSDQRLLEVLAGYASVALENARLYERLRLEAEHAKAWLEFADAMSDADTPERIAEETVAATAALVDSLAAYLWQEDAPTGDFVCVAAAILDGAEEGDRIRAARIPHLAGETLTEMTQRARVLSPEDVHELFRSGCDAGDLAVAPLPSGHGVRGWLAVRAPGSRLNGERLRLLEGLAYRASMALQKARLRRDQSQSLHVANALLEYGRVLATADGDDVSSSVVRLATELLGVSKVSIWLQAALEGEITPWAMWDEVTGRCALEGRFPPEAALPYSDRQGPFVLHREEIDAIPGAAELNRGTDLAFAPFALDQGRMGFMVAWAREGETFGEPQLKMLAGLADQAKLAIANRR